MKKFALVIIGAAALLAASSITPFRKVLADSASFYNWGVNSSSSTAKGDQGGAIELGAVDGTQPNPISGGTPYIDFHYGNGASSDYNARIINNADQTLAFDTQDTSGALKQPLALNNNGATINEGISPSGSGLKHSRVDGCFLGNAAGNYCWRQVDWAGTPFKDSNYTATCTAKGSQYYYTFSVPDSWKTTTSMRIYAYRNGLNTEGNVSTDGFNCIAVHD